MADTARTLDPLGCAMSDALARFRRRWPRRSLP